MSLSLRISNSTVCAVLSLFAVSRVYRRDIGPDRATGLMKLARAIEIKYFMVAAAEYIKFVAANNEDMKDQLKHKPAL